MRRDFKKQRCGFAIAGAVFLLLALAAPMCGCEGNVENPVLTDHSIGTVPDGPIVDPFQTETTTTEPTAEPTANTTASSSAWSFDSEWSTTESMTGSTEDSRYFGTTASTPRGTITPPVPNVTTTNTAASSTISDIVTSSQTTSMTIATTSTARTTTETTTAQTTTQSPLPISGPAVFGENVCASAGADRVELTVNLQNNPGFCGMKLSISYDENTMTLTGADAGTATEALYMMRPGRYQSGCSFSWIAVSIEPEDVKNGVMLTLYFDISDDARAGDHTIELTCEPEDMLDNDLVQHTVAVFDGMITISK